MSMNMNEDAVAVGKGAINYGSKNAQSDYEKRKRELFTAHQSRTLVETR